MSGLASQYSRCSTLWLHSQLLFMINNALPFSETLTTFNIRNDSFIPLASPTGLVQAAWRKC